MIYLYRSNWTGTVILLLKKVPPASEVARRTTCSDRRQESVPDVKISPVVCTVVLGPFPKRLWRITKVEDYIECCSAQFLIATALFPCAV